MTTCVTVVREAGSDITPFSHIFYLLLCTVQNTYLFTSRRYKIVELLSLMIDDDSMSYALLSPSSLNLKVEIKTFFRATYLSLSRFPWRPHLNISSPYSVVTSLFWMVSFADHWHSTTRHSTVQCRSTVQHSTTQCNAAQWSTAQCSTGQRSAAQHSTAQHSRVQCREVQSSEAQHCQSTG